jgi:hypothetical protein
MYLTERPDIPYTPHYYHPGVCPLPLRAPGLAASRLAERRVAQKEVRGGAAVNSPFWSGIRLNTT